MERFAFKPGIRFRMKDQEYLIRKLTGNDVEVSNLSYDDLVELFSLEELLTAWDEKRLIPKRDTELEKPLIMKYDLDLYSKEELEVIENRYQILEPIIMGKVKPAGYKNYIASLPLNLRELTSIPSLYRWKKRWDATQDKRSLSPHNKAKGPRDYRTATEVILIIEGILRENERKGLELSNRDLFIEMKKRVKELNETRVENQKVKPCSEPTVFRVVQDLTDSYEKDKARHGRVQAELNKNGSTTEVVVERPLERIELDWTPIDLLIVDILTLKTKRYYLILAMDKLTGYPLGFYISAKEPNTNDIKQCLLHAMLPKIHLRTLYPRLKHDWLAYGVPETIVVDNAKVNESEDLEEICALMGIELQFCPVKSGNHKGTVERAFQTLNQKVFHGIPGTTFSNTQEKSQYNSEAEACVTLRALYEIIHVTLIELIANDYDISRGGTPEFLWAESLKETRVQRTLPYRKEDLKVLLGTGIEYRTITNKGVEIQAQYYQCSELMKLHDRKKKFNDEDKVRVRFDLADVRVVYIWDEENQRYIEAYPTKNSFRRKKIDPNYPVHYEQLHAYCYNNNRAYREFDTDSIADVRREIDNIIRSSKVEIAELAKISPDERAKKYYEDLAAAQLSYNIQLAPTDIETLQLLSESETNQNKSAKTKSKEGKEKSKTIVKAAQSESEIPEQKTSIAIIHNDDLEDGDEWETTLKKRA